MIKKTISACCSILLSICCTTSLTSSVFAAKAGWIQKGKDWQYQESNGTKVKNKWKKIGVSWYYFNGSGIMQRGWLTLPEGIYYLKSDGSLKTGWIHQDDSWYYARSDGRLVRRNWAKVDGKWYFFDKAGLMNTGWLSDEHGMYYLDSDGAMHTGWLQVDGLWYYMNANGIMQKNKKIEDAQHNTYYLNSDGVWFATWERDLQFITPLDNIPATQYEIQTAHDLCRVPAGYWNTDMTFTTSNPEYLGFIFLDQNTVEIYYKGELTSVSSYKIKEGYGGGLMIQIDRMVTDQNYGTITLKMELVKGKDLDPNAHCFASTLYLEKTDNHLDNSISFFFMSEHQKCETHRMTSLGN